MHGTRVLGRGQAGHVEAVDQARQLGAHMQGQLALARLGQLQGQLGRWDLAPGDGAKVLLRQLPDLVGAHVADHHQGGIVGRVPGLVPVAQLLDLHALEVGHPADGRGVVATGRIGHGAEQLERLGVGLVVGAQAALLLDDFDLAAELLGRQAQAGHAVGLQLQGHRQAVASQNLVVGGVVITGEGVLLGAEIAQDARSLAGAELGAALEHHVLECVGQPGLARGLVAGTDLIPDLRDHDRGAMVFAHHHFQAIVETEFVGGLGIGGKRGQGQAERA